MAGKGCLASPILGIFRLAAEGRAGCQTPAPHVFMPCISAAEMLVRPNHLASVAGKRWIHLYQRPFSPEKTRCLMLTGGYYLLRSCHAGDTLPYQSRLRKIGSGGQKSRKKPLIPALSQMPRQTAS